MELLVEAKRKSSDTIVILMTGYADIRMAVSAIKKGAYEYVTKPINPDEILLTISNALQWRLQYGRVIEKAGAVTGIRRLR